MRKLFLGFTLDRCEVARIHAHHERCGVGPARRRGGGEPESQARYDHQRHGLAECATIRQWERGPWQARERAARGDRQSRRDRRAQQRPERERRDLAEEFLEGGVLGA